METLIKVENIYSVQHRYWSLRCARSIFFGDSGQQNVTSYKASRISAEVNPTKLIVLLRLNIQMTIELRINIFADININRNCRNDD